MTQATSLQDRAMLATLNISQWTNRKFDKSVSIEVEVQHGAKDAGRYNKQLIDKSALDPINKVASAARTHHYAVTLPWGDNGDRLLPSTLFMDYQDHMRNVKAEFEKRVREFVQIYPALVQSARQRLGTMYEPGDYPKPYEIAERFNLSTSFTQVPASADFRVNLNQEYVDAIKSDMESMLAERQTAAMKDCWARVRTVVGKIHERLSDKDKTFRDSLIDNARELVAVLPHLNITGDKELVSIADDVKLLLLPPDRLRGDAGVRTATADRAAEIMNRMAAYMP